MLLSHPGNLPSQTKSQLQLTTCYKIYRHSGKKKEITTLDNLFCPKRYLKNFRDVESNENMNFILSQFCSNLGATDECLKITSCTGFHFLLSTVNFHLIQVVGLPHLSHQMWNYTAMCSFINVPEQVELKYPLLYCDECMYCVNFESPTESESIVRTMSGICMVNTLLWEIPARICC